MCRANSSKCALLAKLFMRPSLLQEVMGLILILIILLIFIHIFILLTSFRNVWAAF